jgi:hypothetical protein
VCFFGGTERPAPHAFGTLSANAFDKSARTIMTQVCSKMIRRRLDAQPRQKRKLYLATCGIMSLGRSIGGDASKAICLCSSVAMRIGGALQRIRAEGGIEHE